MADITKLTSNQWAMIKARSLIDAIKIYRDVYPECGLFEAKQAVQLIKDEALLHNPTKTVCQNCQGTGLVDV